MKNKYIAFKGRQELKDKFVARMRAHALADELIQGVYWQNGKGCATGCLMHSASPHKQMEKVLGIPETVAYLEDSIFEGLDNKSAKKFAQKFIEVIPVGKDLSLVTPRFMVWLMKDLRKYAKGCSDVLRALKEVESLYQRIIDGGDVTDREWESAVKSAWSAWSARSAAWSARSAGSAAWSAWSTRSAARSAGSAARSAGSAAWSAWSAWSAAESVAWSARSAAYKRMAEKLLSLLQKC